MTKPLLPLLATILMLPLASCSLGFKRDWKEAAAKPMPPHDLSGAWVGTWKSVATGHQGTLKAIATPVIVIKAPQKVESDPPVVTTPTVYEFRYHATWGKILSGGYTTHHTVKRNGATYVIGGEHNLGKLMGGVYRYEGAATPTDFKATYTSSLDNGLFEMQRPEKSPPR